MVMKMKKNENWKMQIPNILSFLRVLMVGAFIYYFQREMYFISLGIYVLAIITDALDGYLARHYNWITNLGKVLDPLADKLMLMTALACFYTREWIPIWLLIIVMCKEVIMIIGGALLFKREIIVFADWFGKFATVFFNAGVIATLLKRFWPELGNSNIVLLFIAMMLALIALVHYAKKNVLPNIKKFGIAKQNIVESDAAKNGINDDDVVTE